MIPALTACTMIGAVAQGFIFVGLTGALNDLQPGPPFLWIGCVLLAITTLVIIVIQYFDPDSPLFDLSSGDGTEPLTIVFLIFTSIPGFLYILVRQAIRAFQDEKRYNNES